MKKTDYSPLEAKIQKSNTSSEHRPQKQNFDFIAIYLSTLGQIKTGTNESNTKLGIKIFENQRKLHQHILSTPYGILAYSRYLPNTIADKKQKLKNYGLALFDLYSKKFESQSKKEKASLEKKIKNESKQSFDFFIDLIDKFGEKREEEGSGFKLGNFYNKSKIVLDFFSDYSDSRVENLSSLISGSQKEKTKISEAKLKNFYKDYTKIFKRKIKAMNKTKNSIDELTQKLIQTNLKLVPSAIKRLKIANKQDRFLELSSYGNEGLMNAAALFDYRRGFTFSTYATSAIKRKIFRGLKESYGIGHQPEYITSQLARFNADIELLTNVLGKTPSNEEISEFFITSTGNQLSKDHVKLWKSLTLMPANPAFESFSSSETNPEDDSSLSELKSKVAFALTKLQFRNREIIKLRFGLSDGYKYTLEEVGNIFGITRERVRQIEKKTLSRLQFLLSDFQTPENRDFRSNAVDTATFTFFSSDESD